MESILQFLFKKTVKQTTTDSRNKGEKESLACCSPRACKESRQRYWPNNNESSNVRSHTLQAFSLVMYSRKTCFLSCKVLNMMLTAILSVIAPNWETTQMSTNRWTNCGTSIMCQQLLKISYDHVLQCGYLMCTRSQTKQFMGSDYIYVKF